MNDAIFYDMIKDEFNRIKDSPTDLNTFIKLKSFELQDYQKLNDASPNSVSIQAIGILQTYIGNASQRLNEISKKAEAEVIAILTDVLNKTEAQPTPEVNMIASVTFWSDRDKARFLYKLFPNEKPIDLEKKYKKILGFKKDDALYRNLKKIENNEIEINSKKIDNTIGIEAMKLFLKNVE